MTIEKERHPCPACGQQTLVAHCSDDSRICTWQSCRNTTCDLEFDFKRGRGHRRGTEGNKVIRVEFRLEATA